MPGFKAKAFEYENRALLVSQVDQRRKGINMSTEEMARQLAVRQAAQFVKNAGVRDLFDGVASDAAANSKEAAELLENVCL